MSNSRREWLELRQAFEQDRAGFVFDWAINFLRGVDYPLPDPVASHVAVAPLSSFRRLLYAHDWEATVRGPCGCPPSSGCERRGNLLASATATAEDSNACALRLPFTRTTPEKWARVTA
jgi:hypothetical protein